MNKNMKQIIDDELTEKQDWKPAIVAAGQVIYILGVIYAGAHVLAWTKATLTSFVFFGYIGSVAVIANAVVLPWAIKEWTFENRHRAAAIAFYIIDLILLAGFVWADTNLTRGVTSEALEAYLTNISPITFINAILTWGTLMILDPENLEDFKLKREMKNADIILIRAKALAAQREAEKEAARILGASPKTDFTLPEKEFIDYPPPETFSTPVPENPPFPVPEKKER